MNWLLIIVLVILSGNALIGMRVGFIKTVFSLCSLTVALVLTVWISPTVNDILKGNEKIFNTITSGVEKMLKFEDEVSERSKQVSLIEELNLPQSIKDSLIESNNTETYEELKITSFKEYICSYLAGIIIKAMAFIITFMAFAVILYVISAALDLISKLPLIDQANTLAGLLAGFAHGLVVIWLFFILLTVFGSTDFGQKAMQLVGESEILSFIYNNNIILGFITSITKLYF